MIHVSQIVVASSLGLHISSSSRYVETCRSGGRGKKLTQGKHTEDARGRRFFTGLGKVKLTLETSGEEG